MKYQIKFALSFPPFGSNEDCDKKMDFIEFVK